MLGQSQVSTTARFTGFIADEPVDLQLPVSISTSALIKGLHKEDIPALEKLMKDQIDKSDKPEYRYITDINFVGFMPHIISTGD